MRIALSTEQMERIIKIIIPEAVEIIKQQKAKAKQEARAKEVTA